MAKCNVPSSTTTIDGTKLFNISDIFRPARHPSIDSNILFDPKHARHCSDIEMFEAFIYFSF